VRLRLLKTVARNRKGIAIERAALEPLPERRTADYECLSE
jgi:hypothetical protein